MKWCIAADTGGTFTDCHALDPQGRESRCKVLSTGHLRAVLERRTNIHVRLSGLPPLPVDFLIGFRINDIDGAAQHTITAFNNATNEIALDAPPSWQTGTLLELTTGEEAPVLGARILTNTPPGRDSLR